MRKLLIGLLIGIGLTGAYSVSAIFHGCYVVSGCTGISSVTDGGLLYGSSTNQSLNVLPIGTNNYVLTVSGGYPSWQPATGGGGATTTINGLSAINYTFSTGSGIAISTSAPGTITFLNTAAGGGATTTVQVGAGGPTINGPTFIYATGTSPTGLDSFITGSGSTVTWTHALQSGYNIPLTASTTNWNNLYNNVLSRLAVATGTSGTIFNISTTTNSLIINLPIASGTNTGQLSATDWTTFNNKQPAGSYLTSSSTLTAGGVATFSPNITFASTTDTNILLNIFCATTTCTLNPSWTGTLADNRIASAATWNAKVGNAYASTSYFTLWNTVATSPITITTSSNPTIACPTCLTLVTADSPLSGSGTSGSHLIFTNPGYILGSYASSSFFSLWNTIPGSNITITTSSNPTIAVVASPTFTNIVANGTLNVTGQTTLGTASATSASISGNLYTNIASGNCVHTTTGGLLVSTGSDCGAGASVTIAGLTDSTFVLQAGTNITITTSTSPSTITINSTGGGSGNSAWTIGNGLIYNATSTDLVGIGTITPTTTLFVQGKGGTSPFTIASSTGSPLLTVNQGGNIIFGVAPSTTSYSIQGTTQTETGGAGNLISITGATGNATGTGGGITIVPGVGGSTGNGGTLTLKSGTAGASGNGNAGSVLLIGGDGKGTGTGGGFNLEGGFGGVTSGAGGLATIKGGDAVAGNGAGGWVVLRPGRTRGAGATAYVAIETMSPNTVYAKFEPVNLTADRIFTFPDVDGTFITTGNLTSITSVGTIASGVWNGTVIGTTFGGTSTTTAPTVTGQILAADSTGTKYAPTNLVAGTNITLTTSTPGYITITAASGGGSGTISTSTQATPGKVAVWTGLATLGNGSLFDNGTVAGVNATSSTISFNVQGSTTLDPFNVSSSTGTSILRVTALGYVGIGTTTPQGSLTIQGTSGQTANLLTVASSSGASIFQVVSNAQSIMTIGTTTTTSNLTVQGDSAFPTQTLLTLASSSGASLFQILANGSTTIDSLNASNCDVKSTTGGSLYCGVDATGGAGGGTIGTSTNAQIGSVAIWTGLATLGNGKLFDNGTVIGMNATSSTIGFNIQGTAGTNDIFNAASSSGTSFFKISANGTTTIVGQLIIPAAAATVLNATGQIAVNTTAGTLSFYDGTRQSYLNPMKSIPFTFENPGTNEDEMMQIFSATSTIDKILCVNKKGNDLVNINLVWDNSVLTATSSVTSRLFTSFQACNGTTTPTSLTSFASTTVNSLQTLRLITSTASTSQVNFTIFYHENQ